MNGCAIVDKGLEETAALEIAGILPGTKATCHDGFVTFPVKKKEDLLTLAYKGQSFQRILLFLGTFPVHDTQDGTLAGFKKALPKSLARLVPKDRSFRVDCERHGSHGFTSMDFAAAAGDAIISMIGPRRVSMRSPDAIIYVLLSAHQGAVGLDITGKNLGKRHYKIFLQPSTIKGTLAYAVIRAGGFVPGEALLDPFSGVGTIPIEAAFYATSTPPQAYTKEFSYGKLFKEDIAKVLSKEPGRPRTASHASRIIGADRELRLVKAAQKNAKIAGVEKALEFTRIDIEWLDTRFSEGEVDRIVTQPPAESRNTDRKELEMTLKEFFHQAAFILKKKGTVAVITPTPEAVLAHAQGFTCTKKHAVYSGEQHYSVLVFKKEGT